MSFAISANFKNMAFFVFCRLYLLESFKNGYYNNKYEVEARQAGTKKPTKPLKICRKLEIEFYLIRASIKSEE